MFITFYVIGTNWLFAESPERTILKSEDENMTYLFSSNNSSNQRQHSPVPDFTPGFWALCCSKSLAGEHRFPPTASQVCSELPRMVLSRKQGCESPHLLLTSVMVPVPSENSVKRPLSLSDASYSLLRLWRKAVFHARLGNRGYTMRAVHMLGGMDSRENWSLYFPISIFYITGVDDY